MCISHKFPKTKTQTSNLQTFTYFIHLQKFSQTSNYLFLQLSFFSPFTSRPFGYPDLGDFPPSYTFRRATPPPLSSSLAHSSPQIGISAYHAVSSPLSLQFFLQPPPAPVPPDAAPEATTFPLHMPQNTHQ